MTLPTTFRRPANLEMKLAASGSRHSILVGNIDLPNVQAAIKRLGLTVADKSGRRRLYLAVNTDEVWSRQVRRGHVLRSANSKATGAWRGGHGVLFPQSRLLTGPPCAGAASQTISVVDQFPTVNYIKRQLRTFAAFKLNLHSFYMEQRCVREPTRL